MRKNTIVWILRVFMFALFVFSAVAKLVPVWAFEKQLVDLGFVDWCQAPILARLIIALEIALGIAILQPHYLKRIVLPATMFLLVAFCIHLVIEMVKHGAMSGNCGCFGQLIPMTPLEAFVKNILTLGILVYIYINVTDKPKGENSFLVPFNIWLASTFMIFILIPYCPCPCKDSTQVVAVSESEDFGVAETPGQEQSAFIDSTERPSQSINPDTVAKLSAPAATDTIAIDPGPKKVKSRFTAQNVFDGKKVDINDGKKIICFFAPGCDHCQDAAKELTKLSKSSGFPKVYIYFIEDEIEKIPEFHKIAGRTFPSKVIAPGEFWTLFGPSGSTPGIHYLWNGNIIKSFEGTGENAFTPEKLKQAFETNKFK